MKDAADIFFDFLADCVPDTFKHSERGPCPECGEPTIWIKSGCNDCLEKQIESEKKAV